MASAYSTSLWFKHILFMTEHDKGLGRAKKLLLFEVTDVKSTSTVIPSIVNLSVIPYVVNCDNDVLSSESFFSSIFFKVLKIYQKVMFLV